MNLTLRALPIILGMPFLAGAAVAGDPLVIHDPIFYPVLEKNSKVDCRHFRDRTFGFLLERGDSEEVRVHLISGDKVEGESSAFTALVLKRDLTGIKLQHVSRKGEYGKFVEFTLSNRMRPDYGYRMPGFAVMATKLYSDGPDGKEKEDVYLDGNFSLACKIISGITR